MNWFDTKTKKIGAGMSAMALLFAIGTLIRGDTKAALPATPVTVVNATPVPVSQQRSVKAPLPVNQPHHAPARATVSSNLNSSFGKLPLAFEINQGQTDGQVKFLSHGKGYTLFLTGDEAVLTLKGGSQKGDRANQTPKARASLQEIGSPKLKAEDSQPASTLRMKLLGANAGATVMGAEELPGRSNYFIGNDPKKWRTGVPNYAKVRYQDVYPGVDLVYYGNQGGHLEYDFIVAPGADPNVVRLDVAADTVRPAEGQRRTSPRIAENGDLVVKTDGGEVRFQKPVVYQEQFATRHSIDGRYVLRGERAIGFEVASYDHRKPLIIDPVLSYSTYLGGNVANGIAVDSAGNAYITGVALSNFFSTTPGAFQTISDGANNAFITKLNATGSALVYSTYLSGSANVGGNAQGLGIAVDSADNAYVTGWTTATDFPTTPGAFQTAIGDPTGTSAFITKLNPAGSALVYSTYLGGNRVDEGYGISLDSVGNAYVTGYTDSTNFPTVNAFQTTFGGGTSNAFVTKLNTSGSALVYSTYLGGSGLDWGKSIAIDSSNNAYVTGWTSSTNFPTANPFQAALGIQGAVNAFVTKFDASGALAYSTYLGGTANDYGASIAVDSAGNAYITGYATAGSYPTANAYQAACSGGIGCVIVAKLNATGSTLIYSTYLGGTGDQGFGIAVDAAGNAYVTGATGSATFPIADPIQATCGNCSQNGDNNVFVTNLNAVGSLIYSTYLSGTSGADSGTAIAVDSAGNAYVAGTTGSSDFPTTQGSYQTLLLPNEFVSLFVAKIASGSAAATSTNVTAPAITYGATANVTVAVTSGQGTVTGNVSLSVDSGAPLSQPLSSGSSVFHPSGLSAGSHNLSASFSAQGSFAASSGSGTLMVNKATPTISINDIPSNATYGGNFTPTFAYSGDGSTSASSSTAATCTVSGTVVSFVGAGMCTLTAHGTAGTNYLAIDGAPQSFTIAQLKPVISINNLPDAPRFGGSFTPAYSYLGDGATSVTSGTTGTCTVSGAVVNFTGAGTCTLTAHATATANSAAATGSPQSFVIGQADPTINISNIPGTPVYGGSFTPQYAYAGNGKTSTTSSTPSTCTVSNKGHVSFIAVGTCSLTAHATATANYAAATGALQSITIAKATAAISIKNIPNSPRHGGSFTPTYSYVGDGSPSASSSTPATCSVSGSVVDFLAAGSCTLTAQATAGQNYAATTGIPQTVTVK